MAIVGGKKGRVVVYCKVTGGIVSIGVTLGC